MRGQDKLIAGLIVGAGTMYLLDPDRGAGRRDRLAATARDFRNRSAGAVAELRSRLRDEPVGDETLDGRVRSALGRVVSHPGAIHVTVSQERVTLTGDVLLDEVNELIGRVERIPGVSEVRNELVMHRTANGVSALQGGGGREQNAWYDSWNPTSRLILGAAGSVMAIQGGRMKGPGGRALAFLGSGLLSRAVSRIPSPPASAAARGPAETPADPVMSQAAEPEATTRSVSKRRRSKR